VPSSESDEMQELYALLERLPGDRAPARARALLERLERREARLRAVVHDHAELVFRFHAGGRITFVNPACCLYWGRDRVELLGRPVRSLLLEDGWKRLLRTARSLARDDSVATIDLRVDRSRGDARWQEWTLRLIRPEQPDISGNTVVGSAEYQVSARDVTDLRQQQHILAQHIAEKRRVERELLDARDRALARIEGLEQQVEASRERATSGGTAVEPQS